jgi:hypothetical protein
MDENLRCDKYCLSSSALREKMLRAIIDNWRLFDIEYSC